MTLAMVESSRVGNAAVFVCTVVSSGQGLRLTCKRSILWFATTFAKR